MFKLKKENKKLKKASNVRRDKIFLSVVAVFVSLYSAFSLTAFACAAQSVKNDVVRLHILANSDSEEDQNIKIKVRDALLEKNTRLLSDGVCKENARAYFTESNQMLLETAKEVLRDNGFNYGVKVTLENEYFKTREYGSLTFPAGEYLSLKIVLGEGKGQNWWCVMFPPMCVPVADDVNADGKKTEEYLTEEGNKLINGGNKYVMKFKIIELYEELRDRLGV